MSFRWKAKRGMPDDAAWLLDLESLIGPFTTCDGVTVTAMPDVPVPLALAAAAAIRARLAQHRQQHPRLYALLLSLGGWHIDLEAGEALAEGCHGMTEDTEAVTRLPAGLALQAAPPSPGGRRVEATPSLPGVLDHEMGHALEQAFAEAAALAEPGWTLEGAYAAAGKEAAQRGLSGYVGQDCHEWLAESLAAWLHPQREGAGYEIALGPLFERVLGDPLRADAASSALATDLPGSEPAPAAHRPDEGELSEIAEQLARLNEQILDLEQFRAANPPVSDAVRADVGGQFREEEHPRGGEGTKQGGKFIAKGSVGDPLDPKQASQRGDPVTAAAAAVGWTPKGEMPGESMEEPIPDTSATPVVGAQEKPGQPAKPKKPKAPPKPKPKGKLFASPNILEGMDFEGAIKGLSSIRQSQLMRASGEINANLKLKATDTAAIGAWSDGAENSVMTEIPNSTLDKLRAVGAMKAALADQKAALIFQEDEKGEHALYSFAAKGTPEEIHQAALEDGLEFHTIVPTEGGATVYVADLDGSLADAVAQGAQRYGAEVEFSAGTAEFLGNQDESGTDRDQRDRAQADYARIIGSSRLQGAQDLWSRLHSAYGETLGVNHPLEGSKGHPALISSRRLGSATAIEGDKYRRADLDGMKEDAEVYKHNVNLLKDTHGYPNLRPEETEGKTPDQIARAAIKHAKANLKFLYDNAPEELKNQAHLWYEGAHDIAQAAATKYGLPLQSAAGVYAALSPQKLWDGNVYLGDALLDIYHNQQNTAWDQKMDTKADELWLPKKLQDKAAAGDAKAIKKLEKQRAAVDLVRGKKLSELTSSAEKATWIRIYDEVHSDRTFDRLSPDGKRLGKYYNDDGVTQAKVGWQSNPAIINAIDALESGGDHRKISLAMGDRHKVRSFYNNILDPESDNDDVTMDTHAVGAALLRPVTGKSTSVLHSLATGPEKGQEPPGWQGTSSSSVTGSSGTYALWADAYRELAKELKIKPRVLQSLTWEAKRRLFDPNMKKATVDAVEKAWRDYHDGKADLAATQANVLKLAGGMEGKRLQGSPKEPGNEREQQQIQRGTGEASARADDAQGGPRGDQGELHQPGLAGSGRGRGRLDIGERGRSAARAAGLVEGEGRLARRDIRIDAAPGAPDAVQELAAQAAGLLLRCQGEGGERVLFVRHAERGTWELPGGMLEPGETAAEAAVREVGEELGATPYGAPTLLMRNTLMGTDYATFSAAIAAPFEPDLQRADGELSDWIWAAPDAPPEPLHPGVRQALGRLRMNELGVARAIASGEFSSPQQYDNLWLFAMRVTGTGISYRPELDEHVWRPPDVYLNSEFLQRIAGLAVIWVHPQDTQQLNTHEYRRRNIGSIMFGYIEGDEVWCIARIYDGEAAEVMRSEQVSTSPAVKFGNPLVNETRQLANGEHLLIEGDPSLIDHLAVVSLGVWDKGGPATGVALGEPEAAEAEHSLADVEAADEEPAEPSEMEELSALLAMVGACLDQMEALPAPL